jgi:AcrR family transcriptional regulator
MAYEVVKEIRGHKYRYSVESFRDPQSGKVRNKWTYIGRAKDGAGAKPRRRSGTEETAERILQAFLALIAGKPLNQVTPAAIARKAGVTPATFYRHFRSRDAIVAVCTERATKELDRRLAELDDIAPTAEEERLRLRAFAIDLVRKPSAPPALFRAWSALSPEMIREARHRQRKKAFENYIERLQSKGYIAESERTRRLAFALSMMVHMFTRRSVIENKMLSEEEYAVVGDVFEQLVFARPSGG